MLAQAHYPRGRQHMAVETLVNTKVEVARAAGAVGVFTIWGFTLQDWAALLAVLYSLLQIYLMLPAIIKVTAAHYNNLKVRLGFKKSP